MAIKTKQDYDEATLLDRLDDLIGDFFHQLSIKVEALPDEVTEDSKAKASQFADEFHAGTAEIVDKFVHENPAVITSMKRFYRGSRVDMYSDLGTRAAAEYFIQSITGNKDVSVPDLVKQSLDQGRTRRDSERAKALGELEPQAAS